MTHEGVARAPSRPSALRSELDDDWDDHGAAAVVLVDPPPHRAADKLAKLVRVVDAVSGGVRERLLDQRPHVHERRVVDTGPARMDLRAADPLARGRADHHDDADTSPIAEHRPVLRDQLDTPPTREPPR